MKAFLLVTMALALAVSPAHAGVSVSINLGGGGFHGGYFSNGGGRCGYSANCYPQNRSCAYYGYPGYAYSNYGYNYGYGGYSPYYYSGNYDVVSYSQPYALPPYPAQAPVVQQAPAPTPEPQPQVASATPAPVAAPAPAPAPMEFGILDVNGYVHSPYSDALLKIPGVRNAQMVYDPVTGKPFLVR